MARASAGRKLQSLATGAMGQRYYLEAPQPPGRKSPASRACPLVDAVHYEWLNQYKWTARQAGRTWYAHRHRKGGSISMHREIMRPGPGLVVDHIDRNGLHNRESNLRVCTPAENQRNRPAVGGSSQYKGVSYDKEHKKWEAGIHINGRRIHIGLFESEIEAARAYDRVARELFGEFAYLNFPEEVLIDA